jgi:hypothetical protein
LITTLDTVKTLLKLSNTTNDALIETLIPIIQDDILSFLKNKFLTEIEIQKNTISFVGNTIIDSGNGFLDACFLVGDIVVQGSKMNDGFYTVIEATAGTLTLSEVLMTETADNTIKINQVRFPPALSLVVANMIGYAINNKHGVKSETFSRYSVAYSNDTQSLINGYPDSITRPLLKWRKIYNDY